MTRAHGYTLSMKTAISIPSDVFEAAERFARSSGRSRSELYSAAVREYVARHAPNQVTASLNAAVADLGPGAEIDPFVQAAARHVLASTEW